MPRPHVEGGGVGGVGGRQQISHTVVREVTAVGAVGAVAGGDGGERPPPQQLTPSALVVGVASAQLPSDSSRALALQWVQLVVLRLLPRGLGLQGGERCLLGTDSTGTVAPT